MDKETRTFTFSLEKRDDDLSKLIGHAAVFNEETDIFGFREKIAPGAFSDSIKTDDVRALFNHNPDYILGRNKAGTLTMKEDRKGLAVEIMPPDTQFARDLTVSMKRGDITQMSFAFQVLEESWDYGDGDRADIRTLEVLRLFDVSPVTYPAYEGTDIAVRSHDKWRDECNKKDKWKTNSLRRKHNLKKKKEDI